MSPPDPPSIRYDGRAADALRELSCEQGMLQGAMGSAQWQQGGTTAIVAVYGPSQPLYSRHERHDCCTVEVQFSSSSFGLRMNGALFNDGNSSVNADSSDSSATTASNSCTSNITASSTAAAVIHALEVTPPEAHRSRYESAMGAALKRVLLQCVMIERFPRQLLAVSCYVVSDDGSALACTINALSLALMDAGLPMRCCAAAVCVSRPAAAEGLPPLLIDPLLSEQCPLRASYVATFSFASGSTEAAEAELLLAEVSGTGTGTEALLRSMDAARGAANVLFAFMRLAIKETYQLP